ncbi:MAG: hypothetical protein NUW23_12610, partial [Firmicutes bacterium]|nr:hypothetical protein [Bacillota bacterium]
VLDIRFHTGEVPQDAPVSAQQAEDPEAWRRIELGRADKEIACREASAIEDPNLREKFVRLRETDLRYRKWVATHPARCASEILRREPWLSESELAAILPDLTLEDRVAAREVVAREIKGEIAEELARGAGRSGDARRELRLLVVALVSLLAGEPPQKVDEELAARVAGEDYASILRQV